MADLTGGSTRSILLPAAAMLWAGMIVGVSFIATPVKFLAESLTLPVALDVGRQTFTLFNRIELGAVAVVAALIAFGRPRSRLGIAAAATAGAAVILQAVWLLPLLRQRTDLVVAGAADPGSSTHLVYIAVETVKLLAVLTLAYAGVRRRGPAEGWRGTPG